MIKNSSNFNPRICFKQPIAHHHPTKTYKSWEFCRSTQIILWHDLASEDAILKDPGIQTEATIVPWQPDACWESEGGGCFFETNLSESCVTSYGFPTRQKPYSSPNEGLEPPGPEISWNMNPNSCTTCQEFRKKQGCRLGPESIKPPKPGKY